MPTAKKGGKAKGGKPEEKQEIAGFLLSLKHGSSRSVSPAAGEGDPPPAEDTKQPATQEGDAKPTEEETKKPEATEKPEAQEEKAAAETNPIGKEEGKEAPAAAPTEAAAAAAAAAAVPPVVQASAEAVAAAAAAAAAAVVEPVAAAPTTKISIAQDPSPQPFVPFNFEHLVEGSDLVSMKDRDLVPDALFLAIAQCTWFVCCLLACLSLFNICISLIRPFVRSFDLQ